MEILSIELLINGLLQKNFFFSFSWKRALKTYEALNKKIRYVCEEVQTVCTAFFPPNVCGIKKEEIIKKENSNSKTLENFCSFVSLEAKDSDVCNRSFVCLFVRLLARSFVCLFVCLLLRLFVCLLLSLLVRPFVISFSVTF